MTQYMTRKKIGYMEWLVFVRKSIMQKTVFCCGKQLGLSMKLNFPLTRCNFHLSMNFSLACDAIPKGSRTGSDLLLYTALTDATSASPQYTCGVLIDEWTEVIPLEKETTGLTFHYDRPNAEAPQTMLFITPTKITGHWAWEDIVDALHYT